MIMIYSDLMIFSVGKVGMLSLVLEPLESMPTDDGNSNEALHTGCSSMIHACTVALPMCVLSNHPRSDSTCTVNILKFAPDLINAPPPCVGELTLHRKSHFNRPPPPPRGCSDILNPVCLPIMTPK